SGADAAGLGICEGAIVRVESRRGMIEAPARITDIAPGHVFAPFHYGYFDRTGAGPDNHPTAANELTLTEWDPVSRQPYFKFAAVRVRKIADSGGMAAPAPTTTGSAPSRRARREGEPEPEPTAGGASAHSSSQVGGS
ncbi:MAG: nitrate reductase, partial [Chloroflexota bacterium]|nr:nitrate reductase [Chloroflexota bacterium]